MNSPELNEAITEIADQHERNSQIFLWLSRACFGFSAASGFFAGFELAQQKPAGVIVGLAGVIGLGVPGYLCGRASTEEQLLAEETREVSDL